MLCPNCGYSAHTGDEFCRNCGVPLPAEAPKREYKVPQYANVPQNEAAMPVFASSVGGAVNTPAVGAQAQTGFGVRLLRVVAFVMDGALCLFVPLFTFVMAAVLLQTGDEMTETLVAVMLLVMLASMWLRDVICRAQSVGKKTVRICVCDRNTGRRASRAKCLLRSTFLFFFHIEAIMLLVSGRTIGDRVAGTVVLPVKEMQRLGTYSEK